MKQVEVVNEYFDVHFPQPVDVSIVNQGQPVQYEYIVVRDGSDSEFEDALNDQSEVGFELVFFRA